MGILCDSYYLIDHLENNSFNAFYQSSMTQNNYKTNLDPR